MPTIVTKSYPRAALIGNPSDGYHGKTIAFVFSNFSVKVVLEQNTFIKINIPENEQLNHESLDSFIGHIGRFGYYGGERLVKSAIKVFLDHCKENDIRIEEKLFSISYETNVPRSLGLGGSSAIITAVIRALMIFYDVNIPNARLANLILDAETKELGITAGLQDRVAQAYAHPVYMDFNKEHLTQFGIGKYETFNSDLLSHLYIAYKVSNSESSEVVHSDLRMRYNNGEEDVVRVIERLGDITDEFYELLKNRNLDDMNGLINENFDIRTSIMDISKSNQKMIDVARSCEVSAKFTGSGGAIIGMYKSDSELINLRSEMMKIGAEVFLPKVVSS